MSMVGRPITVHGNVEWFSTIFDGDNVHPFPVSGASISGTYAMPSSGPFPVAPRRFGPFSSLFVSITERLRRKEGTIRRLSSSVNTK
jgi:hypothetical protein